MELEILVCALTKCVATSGRTRYLLYSVAAVAARAQAWYVFRLRGSGAVTSLSMNHSMVNEPAGEILFNGHERDPELFSRVTAYLPQEVGMA
eukprot:2496489-Amphidinium_carterae.1